MQTRVIIERKPSRAPTITAAVELQFILTGTPGQLERIADAIRDAVDSAVATEPVEEVSAFGQLRPLTRDEAMEFVPRRKHMSRGGRHICPTPHVSPKNLVEDKNEVTCRLCLKVLKEELEGQVKELTK